jgi:glucose/arabinose dehydrogenase
MGRFFRDINLTKILINTYVYYAHWKRKWNGCEEEHMQRREIHGVKWIGAAVALMLVVSLPAVSQNRNVPQGELVSERLSSQQADFGLVRVVEGLSHPWAAAFLPDGGMLITERPGRLLLLRGGELQSVSGLPDIYAGGQGGLLDVALHPDYTRNGLVYLTHSVSGPGGAGTALYRARLEGTQLRDGEELYRLPRLTGTRRHFGSRIVFGPNGYLYMTIGDRGNRDRAQRLDDAAGSTLRFNSDGSIPEGNPFVDREGARPEIYSYGHRNAQGMAVHPGTGEIWQHEHGPRGGDEVNIIRPGANYGWPKVTYGEEYSGGSIGIGTDAPRFESPIIHWTPSIAPSGMSFYNGDEFPGWKGDVFVGALAGKHLRRLELSGDRVVDQELLLHRSIGRIRDVLEGPGGRLWLLTDEDNGALYRLDPVR